ncbi:MAG TPA: DNA primase [Pseudomonadales bacterium]|nr:DNA primase [Pseudomonadales bacterium]HND27260.1 DNA primase [Pseudomonadales bacterium]HNH19031.1 DNA primase [Pseudomonadales bacterium]HNH71269.1 DNA primase [Pseudomonadales bacterium]
MAGLIPQSFIDDLLERVDIVDLVGERIRLRKSGANHFGLCPFHQEKSPSFSVNGDKQFYHCFGCGASGNALGFLIAYDRLEFPQAVEQLARRVGVALPEGEKPSAQERQREAHHQLLAQVADHYRRQLSSGPAAETARRYLHQRGLDRDIIERFAIGFAPPTAGSALLQQFPTQEQALLELGLIQKSDGGVARDRFRNRVIFPIRDPRGRTVGFGGRLLGEGQPKYLNSSESPLFQKSHLLYGLHEAIQAQRQLDRLLLVEGYMDVVALAQHGLTHAVATLGTATSVEHLKLAYRRVHELLFCFDGDAAGRRAAWRALEHLLPLLQEGQQARFLFLPDGEDPDSLVRKEGAEAFAARSQQAQPLSEFFYSELCAQVDMGSIDGRARLVSLARPFLERLRTGSFRQLMVQRLAELTGIAAADLLLTSATQVEQPDPDSRPFDSMPHARPPLHQRRTGRGRQPLPPAQAALLLLLKWPLLATRQACVNALRDFPTQGDSQLLREVLQQLQRSPGLGVAALLGRWHGTDQADLLARLAARESFLSQSQAEVELDALLAKLSGHGERRLLDALLARPFDALTPDEKAQLKVLLESERAGASAPPRR